MKKLLKKILNDKLYLTTKGIYYYIRHIIVKLQTSFRGMGISSSKFNKIRKMKNLYENKRCFIISMGPSLTIDDIELVKDEITFGMNSIVKLFDKTTWRPTFFGVQDKDVFGNIGEEIKKSGLKTVFVSDDLAKSYKVLNSWVQYPLDLLDHNTNFSRFNTMFSDDAFKVIYDGYSITYSLLQIAVHLGFKEIYMLGNDCNYSTPNSRFLDHGVKATDISTIGERMISAYKYAKEYADEHGIKIVNCTRGGKLEVFPRMKLEDVLRGD